MGIGFILEIATSFKKRKLTNRDLFMGSMEFLLLLSGNQKP